MSKILLRKQNRNAIALTALATVALALLPLSQSAANENAPNFGLLPDSTAVAAQRNVEVDDTEAAQQTEQVGTVEVAPDVVALDDAATDEAAAAEAPALAETPAFITDAELVSATISVNQNTDEAATLMEQLSPNLYKKIAKNSAILNKLAESLESETEIALPTVALGEGLFTAAEVEADIIALLERTAKGDIPEVYTGDEPELAVTRTAMAAQIAALDDFITTAYEINEGVLAGGDVIEGPMEFSHTGVLLLKQFEGLSLTGYLLGDGMCTIGYGIAVPVDQRPDCLEWTITEEEAEEMLAQEVQAYANAVAEHFTRPLTQNQFDALTSFTYNVGKGVFAKYDWDTAPADERISEILPLYVNPPQFSAGLTTRRLAEVALFNS